MTEWIEVTSYFPPNGVEVMTKIHDQRGPRKEQPLKRQTPWWFFPDLSMRIYYEPTHWKPVEREEE